MRAALTSVSIAPLQQRTVQELGNPALLHRAGHTRRRRWF